MHVRPFLVVATAMIAAAPAAAADLPQQRSPERVPTSQLIVPMPAATRDLDGPTPERKGKRVRYTFPAPKRVM